MADPDQQPETALTLPDGRTITLWRTPDQRQPANLRAWDAADELVMHHLHEEGLPAAASDPTDAVDTVVAGDRFGALTVALTAAGLHPIWWGDTVTSWNATGANLVVNGFGPPTPEATERTVWLPLHEDPPAAALAVVKVPKSKAGLQDVLARLALALPPGTPVIGAGMTRNIHTSTVDAFEGLIGPTRTTRARKKARLLLATTDPGRRPASAPAPTTSTTHGLEVTGLPGVFAAEGLDTGTALLLTHLPADRPAGDVVDLGCGTGVVGAVIAQRDPDARVTFTDASWSAVESARQTWATNFGDRPASFVTADGLVALPDGSADLVVVNPPFHQGHEVGDEVAWSMFADARRVLRPGGRIVVVGNRHLGYHAKLGRLFGDATVLGADARFVVLAATRR